MPQGIVGGAVPVSVSVEAWCRIGEADRKAILAHAAASALPYVQKAYIDADAMVRPKLEAVAGFSAGDAAMRDASMLPYTNVTDASQYNATCTRDAIM